MRKTENPGVMQRLKELEECAHKLATEQLETQHRAQLLEQERTVIRRLRSQRDALRTRVTAQSAGPMLDILTETRAISTPQSDQVDVRTTLLKERVKSLQDILEAYHLTGLSVKVRELNSTSTFCISTAYEGIYLDSYYLDIQMQHPRKIISHNIPAFIPLDQTALSYLQQDLPRFLDVLRDALNAYSSRRYQVEQLQELHTASLIGQVQRNAAYNLLKFRYQILCGDMEQDVQVKVVYRHLACCLPTGVTLTCTGADAESVNTKLECHRQLFEKMELYRVFDSLKLQEEVAVSSGIHSTVHSCDTSSCHSI